MAVPTFRGKVLDSLNEAYRNPRTKCCPHCGEIEFPDIGHVFKRQSSFMSFRDDGSLDVTVNTTCQTCKQEWVEVYEIAEIRPKEVV